VADKSLMTGSPRCDPPACSAFPPSPLPGQAQGQVRAKVMWKWTRLFNVVIARQNSMQDGRALVRLVMEVMSPVRFASPAEFAAARARVNERLLLSGLEVREDGKVITVTAAATIGEAQERAEACHCTAAPPRALN
jgi:hypothetical protein